MEIQRIQKVWHHYRENYAKDLTHITGRDIDQKLNAFYSPGEFVSFVFDFGTQEVSAVNEAFEPMLGLKKDELTLEKLLSLIHPEDVAYVTRCEQMAGSFFFENLPPDQWLNYKVTYCFRAKTRTGYRLFCHQAMALTLDNEQRMGKVLNVHADLSSITKFNNKRLSLLGIGDLPSYLCINVHQQQNPSFQKEISYITPRELEVIRLLAEGGNTREIAGVMSISDATVRKHRENLLRKAGAKNTTQLVVQFIREGLL